MISLRFIKIGLVVLIFLVLANLIILNFWIMNINKIIRENKISSGKLIENKTSVTNLQNYCPNDCISRINEATSSTQTSNKITQSDLSITDVNSPGTIKEVFIPFGAGSGNGTDWVDVTGLTAYIDGSKYGKIKRAVFEVSARIPNANQVIWIVLYNVTDQSYLWSSQVTMSGGKPLLLVSIPINLPSKNKLYQVRMKTEVGDKALIDQSRLHIITE